MPKSTVLRRGVLWKFLPAVIMLFMLITVPQPVSAGEGGVSHVIPGAMATMSDLPGTAPAWFLKPLYCYYQGSFSAQLPTAVGLAGDVDATINTVGLVAGRTFETTVLGGAHYTFAMALPFTWLDISANVESPKGTVRRDNTVSGLGDMTILPVMLAWKFGDWQIDAVLPIYAPTGDYKKGRLGNTGLNFWTFDPLIGAVYSNKASGFNAMLHAGYAMNTENSATDYQSGAMLHLEGVIQQYLPLGPGILNLGGEGFYFDQVTGDSGDGAKLGDFKGRTTGLGPVLGYVLPLGKQTLVTELKWLTELDTKRRLEGDFVWVKIVCKF